MNTCLFVFYIKHIFIEFLAKSLYFFLPQCKILVPPPTPAADCHLKGENKGNKTQHNTSTRTKELESGQTRHVSVKLHVWEERLRTDENKDPLD